MLSDIDIPPTPLLDTRRSRLNVLTTFSTMEKKLPMKVEVSFARIAKLFQLQPRQLRSNRSGSHCVGVSSILKKKYFLLSFVVCGSIEGFFTLFLERFSFKFFLVHCGPN